jgi:hypothetical protein
MGKNAGHVLTYKNTDKDPEDIRRVQEIEDKFLPKSLRVFSATPDVKQLKDRQPFIIDDGTTVSLGVRIGNSIKTIALS